MPVVLDSGLPLYFRVAALLCGNLFSKIAAQLKQLQSYKIEIYHLLYTCFISFLPCACFSAHILSCLISMDKGHDDYRDYKIFTQNPSRVILRIFVPLYLLKTETKWTHERDE